MAYTKGYKPTGRPSYDSLVLFKIELLRTWYGLSDGEVEEQVNDRLSFSRFVGLGMEDAVPDSTTVCRFRNILVEADLYDMLLEEFNRQLEAKGVIVKHRQLLMPVLRFGAGIARYVGLSKTHAQHIMESIAYNLYRTPGIIVSNCFR